MFNVLLMRKFIYIYIYIYSLKKVNQFNKWKHKCPSRSEWPSGGAADQQNTATQRTEALIDAYSMEESENKWKGDLKLSENEGGGRGRERRKIIKRQVQSFG